MRILVTGCAGFIGFHVTKLLLESNYNLVGVDSINDYYDVELKKNRLKKLKELTKNKKLKFKFKKIDLSNSKLTKKLFDQEKFECVIHLAAQAGVRHSINSPLDYVKCNIIAFTNILEGCRYNSIKHLIYASTSSVYGNETTKPLHEDLACNKPIQFYAATKKSNEMMAYAYSSLFGIPVTGLRFFTVYGPWGRPDMALFKFTKSIFEGEEIEIFNFGKHKRDFTYIDDIVNGIIKVIEKPPQKNPNWTGLKPDPGSSRAPWKVYNIGNNSPVELEEFIRAIEDSIGLKAKKNFLPLQPGDVPDTYADISALEKDFNYRPNTSIYEGINKFIDWYRDYYRI